MASEFHSGAVKALQDKALRGHLRRAMDMLMSKRQALFPDVDELANLRSRGMSIRAHALSRLPELLEQLEQRCTENGIQVHWAETVEEGNRIVHQILQEHGVQRLVKGKSMVSEEMALNHYLEARGIECLESDLGEFIIQLAGETPSHIVMPALHKSKQEIAELFNQKFPDIPYTDDVDELTAAARAILREKFQQADAGISGVNFLVAESGTLCLVENEGNGRMSTTVPPLHIAVTGIEKVVEKLADVPPLLSLLPRSATGQRITTYFNMINGPRRAGERDGPKAVHLLLLDNGRSRVYADEELQATLRCIRCGACINHCPVYTRLGGHAYGTVYPGPIGSILEPQKAGLDQLGELAEASSLCGACGEVCPVRIPIPRLLNRLRYEGVRQDGKGELSGQGARRKATHAALWRGWASLASHPALYRIAVGSASRFRRLLPQQLGPWTSVRKAPQIAPKPLRELLKGSEDPHE
jgi:L-lactate dehydrogenase complex protein LldF